MVFHIVSYSSVGPLRWGMSSSTVETILGPPTRLSKDASGDIFEFREALEVSCQYAGETGELMEVGFARHAEAVFDGMDLLRAKPRQLVATLIQRDPSCRRGFGSFVFPALGLSLTGFMPLDEDIRAVTAFRAGVWDDIIDEMREKLPSR